MARRGEARAYFDAHVNDITDDCMLWPHATSAGYGVLGLTIDGSKRLTTVTSLACEAHYGPRPLGMRAAHGPCHNPLCWNWQHLRWATEAENNADKRRDGTHIEGSRIPWSKLTEDDVYAIRSRYAAGGITQYALADEYGVSVSVICVVIKRRTWRHVA